MKRLVLIRHAKSDWGEPSLRDFDRPLNRRGKKDAPRMAGVLKERGIYPDLMITSPARRALSTATAMAEVFTYPETDMESNPVLYLGSPADLGSAVDFTPSDVDTLFLFAHNPGISRYASFLTGMSLDMPTCCAVILEGEGEWTDFRVLRWEKLRPGDYR